VSQLLYPQGKSPWYPSDSTSESVSFYVQDLKKADEDFHHINPDFIVGFNNNPFNDTREGTLEKKWGKECIMR
jgi:hypothetical protein